MKKAALFLAITVHCILLTAYCFSQGTAINTSGSAADNSAMLDVSSTSKGILIPRMTKAEKLAISSPANGLLVYQTDDTTGFWYFNSVKWVQAMGSSGASSQGSGRRMFTSNGTFTVPAGVTTVWVTMSGGGGGGGGTGLNGFYNSYGGGGGGADAVKSVALTVTPLTAYNITVGTGGPGGIGKTSGNGVGGGGGNGGSSSFGALLTVNGGGGGAGGPSCTTTCDGGNPGNAGGVGGSPGGTGKTVIIPTAGYFLYALATGGGSMFGSPTTPIPYGGNGAIYGGGGAGGIMSNGGSGAQGFVLVEW